ncbi:DUF397 domain-containing protein [Nocardiopsis sp. RSe5-2]|uniref:DUF397 domain-containing protein n=1 Tax=Nocardiopsis endophytica TaxID=3018445 RepID=A0ABT4U872_9ACTN|nr:DUF397 domain-containing protein [Nocardiopsis endophytica]MDA2813153.1 DUF397 domain-containing protein [Nocardiopsis endophytica]
MINQWHKSSHSGGANDCVEVREHANGADVRDTKHRDAGHLSFPLDEWGAFLQDLRRERH